MNFSSKLLKVSLGPEDRTTAIAGPEDRATGIAAAGILHNGCSSYPQPTALKQKGMLHVDKVIIEF